MNCDFFIPIEPVAASRPRVTRNGRTYYLKAYEDFRDMFKSMAYLKARELKWRMTEEPLKCSLIFKMPRAKSNKKKQYTQKPDIDNLIKAVMDGLNEVFFKDDAQVISLIAVKEFSQDKRETGIYIGLIELNEQGEVK